MALFPLHHELPCKDHVFKHRTSSRQSRGGEVSFDSNGPRRFPAFEVLMKAEAASSITSGLKHRTTVLGRDCMRGKLCLVRASSSETKTIKKRLQLLDSYFGKLQSNDEKPSSISLGDEINREAELSAEKELESLSVYFEKQQKDAIIKPEGGSVASKMRKPDIKSNNNSSFQQLDDDDQEDEDTLNFYVVSILASINVGVCLFEAAAPVRNNDMGLLSLPLLYGAKINDLIVAGEWWRLVTPMFLVQDIQIGTLESLM